MKPTIKDNIILITTQLKWLFRGGKKTKMVYVKISLLYNFWQNGSPVKVKTIFLFSIYWTFIATKEWTYIRTHLQFV